MFRPLRQLHQHAVRRHFDGRRSVVGRQIEKSQKDVSGERHMTFGQRERERAKAREIVEGKIASRFLQLLAKDSCRSRLHQDDSIVSLASNKSLQESSACTTCTFTCAICANMFAFACRCAFAYPLV